MYNEYELEYIAKERVRNELAKVERYRMYKQAKAGQPDRWAILLQKLASLAVKAGEQMNAIARGGNEVKPLTT